MAKKILFSPVGGTDPIRYLRDGSMLHICRHYKPDIVYLYLSKEMLDNHRLDDRYRYTINRLGEWLHHDFEIHLIERENLVDVQRPDLFYEDFSQEIRRIEKTMEKGDELLLNMASGTPGMKSALMVIATLAEYKYKTIQVDSPQKGINAEYEQRDPYDREVNWELDQDNEENADNRCVEIHCRNLVQMLKQDMIKKHIRAFDYPAAVAVAEEIRESIPREAYTLLRIANARVRLDHREISKLNSQAHYDIFPVQDGKYLKMVEYALVLRLKNQKQEYADLSRGITPLVLDLLECILKRQCGIRLEDYCTLRKNGLFWDLQKMEKDETGRAVKGALEKGYENRGGFREGPVYSDALRVIIQERATNLELKKQVGEIVDIEHFARNMAAHEIVSVTEEWVRKRTGKTPEQIFEIIIYLMKEAGINMTEQVLTSYETMNAQIEQMLYL